jgi:hypothetical protein
MGGWSCIIRVFSRWRGTHTKGRMALACDSAESGRTEHLNSLGLDSGDRAQ